MTRHLRHRGAAICALVALVGAASAHDTFLLAERPSLAPGETVSLALSSASTFPAFDHGPEAARIVALLGRVGPSDIEVSVGEQREEALVLTAVAPQAGALAVGLTLGPRDIDLAPDSVIHYFEEIRPGQAALDAWASIEATGGEEAQLLETYTKHAKALVCVAPCPEAPAQPFGHALEFVPLAPLGSRSKKGLFMLIANAEPAADHALNFWTADGAHVALRTDGDGVVSVPLTVPGPAMLSAVDLRPPARDGERFQSDFATLTFSIGGAPAAAATAGAEPAAAAPPYDIVLAGGRVMDPETGLDAVRNVGLRGDRIVEISDAPLAGARVIDVSGLVVAPGFIDLHAHGQTNPAHAYQARDGVTTALELETGKPLLRNWIESKAGRSIVNYGATAPQMFARVAAMPAYEATLPAIEEQILAARAAGAEGDEISAAFATLGASMYEPLEGDEALARLDAALEKDLAAGALGIGLPVGYEPGASWEEILHLFRFAAARGVPIYVHVRDPGIAGIQEMIANAAATGAAVHIVHVNSMALGEIGHAIDLITAAAERGVDVTTELYPYTAASTYLGSALFDGDWQSRFDISYGDLQWQDTGERLTAETFARYRETDGVVIIHMMKEPWIELGLAHPATMIASDGMPYAPGAHPRSAGTFTRVLGRYVRERETLDLMTALAKMSLMPAQRLEGLAPAARFKGRVQVGADADLTVFDPATVIDTATFEGGLALSRGVAYVFVNGVPVVDGGESVDGVFPGEPLLGRYRR